MPTYEYECTSCGHTFECFQSITDKPKRRCPKCGKKVRRLIGTGAGLIFRGEGFYCNDYRPKNRGKKAKSKNASPSGAENKTDSAEKPEKTDKETASSGESKK